MLLKDSFLGRYAAVFFLGIYCLLTISYTMLHQADVFLVTTLAIQLCLFYPAKKYEMMNVFSIQVTYILFLSFLYMSHTAPSLKYLFSPALPVLCFVLPFSVPIIHSLSIFILVIAATLLADAWGIYLEVLISICFGSGLFLFVKMESFLSSGESDQGKARKDTRTLKELLSVIIHDISNPLMVISGSVEVLDNSLKDNLEEREVVKNISDSVTIIEGMIGQVRKLRRLHLGVDQLELAPVNLLLIVQNAQFVFRDKLEVKNIRLVFDENLLAEIDVMAEAISFSNSVINNVISNAIKFSNENSEISIFVLEGLEQIKIYIEDTGVGMSEKVLEEIRTENNSYTSSEGTRGEVGSGFGFPIVKHFVHEYGGSFAIYSVAGEGTSVVLTLNKAKKRDPS